MTCFEHRVAVPVNCYCHQRVDWCTDCGSLQKRRRFAHERTIVPPSNTHKSYIHSKIKQTGHKTWNYLCQIFVNQKIWTFPDCTMSSFSKQFFDHPVSISNNAILKILYIIVFLYSNTRICNLFCVRLYHTVCLFVCLSDNIHTMSCLCSVDLKSGSARTQSVNGFIFRLRFRSLLKPPKIVLSSNKRNDSQLTVGLIFQSW